MGKDSAIPWTHHTFNPWWGCTKVSPACQNCYAERLAKRFWPDGCWGDDPRRFFGGGAHWREPEKWNRAAEKAGERHRVFCGSMCDVFEEKGMALARARAMLFEMIGKTPHLDWLLLTKRPGNIVKMFPAAAFRIAWDNIWLGVTAENQAMADERIPILLDTPAAVRFVSIEPMLGPIDLGPLLGEFHIVGDDDRVARASLLATMKATYRERFGTAAIDWIIVGDESGPGRRPAQLDWARTIRDQCQAAGAPFFFKQWHQPRYRLENMLTDSGRALVGVSGDVGPIVKIECPELDGRQWIDFPERTAL